METTHSPHALALRCAPLPVVRIGFVGLGQRGMKTLERYTIQQGCAITLMAEIEQEKKDAMAEFKERMKPFDEDRKRLLEELKNKSEYVNETCYKFIDHDERMVGYYNKLGELVSSRPIMPQEMQKTTFSINRNTGTES